MARETKVGLLVGLAFIICFAIILANHGQRGALIETMPGYAARPEGTAPRGVGQPAHQVVRGRESAAPAETALRSTPPRTDRDLTVQTSPLQLHQQGVPGVTTPSPESEAMAERVRQLEAQISALLAEKSAQQTTSVATSPPVDPVTLTATPVADPVPSGIETLGVRVTPRTARRAHTIGSGDTLTKIAAKYYGNQSQRVVRLIVEANPSVIKDPDRIPLGAELIIPEDPEASTAMTSAKQSPKEETPVRREVEQPRAATKPPAGSTPAKGASPKAPSAKEEPFRWYQVRKNDRYVSIARQQLGDEGRWKEIFELNKEKFPKEGLIREGVRIKLPASDGVADSRGKRR